MRTHTKTFHIRFTEKEYKRLCQRAKQTGLPKSTYIRFMINGCSPKERPGDQYYYFMRQLIGMCNNVRQIAQKAHALGYIDAQYFHQEAERWNKFRFDIKEHFEQPEKVDIPTTLERGKQIFEKDVEN